MLVSESTKLVGDHGIASGSGWTQLLETLFIMFIGWIRPIRAGQGVGDDFIWLLNDGDSMESVVSTVSTLGLPMNELKQSWENGTLTFLQRKFATGLKSRENHMLLGGYYPTIRALNSSLYPEIGRAHV